MMVGTGNSTGSSNGAQAMDRPEQLLLLRSILNANSTKFAASVVLWAAFTLGSWTSLPETFKFVDEATGWAWFSHCAGVTAFLLVMTRQLQWLFVVPVLGSLLLWMLSLAMPASWIIVSAHSVGYGLLLASIVIAMGVFSRFVCAWRELVSFLTRSCFLYPQLQAGLQDEYPLLVKIVSEYTAGMDPEIMSSRDNNSRALLHALPSSSSSVAAAAAAASQSSSSLPMETEHATLTNRISPRRRLATPETTTVTESTSVDNLSNELAAAHDVDTPPTSSRMVSVLPSFKAGKCFFCSKNDAEHLVPACGMWGKWTHWRMSQQHDIFYGSLALPAGSASSSAASLTKGNVPRPVATMCTSYYDVQQEKSEVERRLTELQTENASLTRDLETAQRLERASALANVQLQADLRALEEKHSQELQRIEHQLRKQMEQILADANQVTHDHKRRLREVELQHRTTESELQSSRASVDELQRRVQDLVAEVESLHATATQRETEVTRLETEIQELRRQNAVVESSKPKTSAVSEATAAAHGITALQPTRRMPYARWLEIEGLRESIRKREDDVTPSWMASFERGATDSVM
ncbi:hypothetical protein PINS_up008274 [Pythium insidiosum]|nr:hypothetical protein PINS_up008274 [Pythium insidiosum]